MPTLLASLILRQVISGVDLMRHPKFNKGLAFSDSERDRLYLRGLIPPAILSQEVQLERIMLNIRWVQRRSAWQPCIDPCASS